MGKLVFPQPTLMKQWGQNEHYLLPHKGGSFPLSPIIVSPLPHEDGEGETIEIQIHDFSPFSPTIIPNSTLMRMSKNFGGVCDGLMNFLHYLTRWWWGDVVEYFFPLSPPSSPS